ncbi:MAG: hypothetical protein AAFR41_00675 [Pseudomonadota bacterium]
MERSGKDARVMEIRIKRWQQLGLGAALASGTLAACSGQPAEDTPAAGPEAVAETPIAPATALGEGEGGGVGEGEGGEGEGGVSIAAAATDPVVFNAALAIVEAHIIAARDAFAGAETDAAAEMFAHPVSEVLANMAPVFEARGVESFDQLLVDASAAVFDGETETQINARAEGILAALASAAEKAPDDGSSAAAIAAGVASDQIERATDMYRAAAESNRYEPYLDGYGFYKAGEGAFLAAEGEIEADDPETAARLREALAALAEAYPGALRPDTLDADQSTLTVAASRVVLAVGH